MSLLFFVAILVGKLIGFVSRVLGAGIGATWPGEIALRLSPHILERFISSDIYVVLVAGTNGKTTTAKMIETVLRHIGKRVAHNKSGANLDNGIVSAFLSDAGWDGKLRSKYFVLEVDENTLPNIVKKLESYKVYKVNKEESRKVIIVLLNLFRDQLDRYGEVDAIAERWLKALQRIRHPEPASPAGRLDSGSTEKMPKQVRHDEKDFSLIINADDPQLAYIGSKLNQSISYFGLENPSLFLPSIQHATDSIYCPQCGNRLTFGGVYYSHLGKWACGQCGLTHPVVELSSRDFNSPIEGVYNKYNTLAASAVCRSLGVSTEHIKEGLKLFTPAFGRMETIVASGKRVKILLSKNPTGFNESLRTAIHAGAHTILLVLNDRIPDGRDVSWIWDVDFELLKQDEHVRVERDKHMIYISGDRCYDMGLRIKYAGLKRDEYHVELSLPEAIQQALGEIDDKETLWVLPTYSAMLDVRKILTGRKIL